MEEKVYLGDSVYAATDEYHIILTTRDGPNNDVNNLIYLDQNVMLALIKFYRDTFGDYI